MVYNLYGAFLNCQKGCISVAEPVLISVNQASDENRGKHEDYTDTFPSWGINLIEIYCP